MRDMATACPIEIAAAIRGESSTHGGTVRGQGPASPALRGAQCVRSGLHNRRRGYSPLSRNFSASSAAMQPKPAEVIACR